MVRPLALDALKVPVMMEKVSRRDNTLMDGCYDYSI
jgi:hypothetical protein